MQDRWDAGLEGTGMEECRIRGMQERRDAGRYGCRKVWVQERRDSRDEECKVSFQTALFKKTIEFKTNSFSFLI